VTATTGELISLRNRERFVRDRFPAANPAGRTQASAAQVTPAPILVLPHGVNLTCHYQGVSHAEWPKNNDEYAPPQIGEAICQPLKAVDIECRPPRAEGLSKRAKKV
jgi:hypothetical protein